MEQGDRKARTRRRILEAAGRGFRSRGYAGVGVDGIAQAAEVTSGAFYAHFGSKDGAFEAALAAGLDEVIEGIPRFQEDKGADWVEAFAAYYLGKAHRGDLECGCAMTTLSPEVVRAAPETQSLYRAKMERIVGLAAEGLAGGSPRERRARALAMLSVLIGGLTTARAVGAERLSKEIAQAVRAAAKAAAGKTKAVGRKSTGRQKSRA